MKRKLMLPLVLLMALIPMAGCAGRYYAGPAYRGYWVPGHYAVGPYGGTHWVPGHYR